MATEISLNDLTNGTIVSQEWQGAGVFDVLIAAVNKNIEIQFSKGRITGSNYADVYLGSMQAVLQQSVEFLLRKDLTETQIDSELKNLELKEHQLIADRNKIEAELEKQWGYDVTRDANGELVLGASTGNGKVDKDIAAVVNSIETNNQEIELKTRQVVDQELTSATQRQSTQDEIELKTRQVVDQELTSATQRQATQDEIELKTRQVVDQELTSVKQRVLLDAQDEELDKKILLLEEQRKAAKAEVVIKDKEAAKLGLDNAVKLAEAERLATAGYIYTPKYGV